ncbi:MAG TPA: hypothetical protein VFE52_00325, partial [Devosia sp.]|nr:hypothetical protein [Devosia sp.]
MLTISKAALFAATLGLSAPLAVAVPAVAQEATALAFSVTLEVPTVTAVDSSMSEDQLRDVFTSNFLSHADELARLTATSITIPEITLSMTGNDGMTDFTSTVIYRDTVLTNVRDGIAESMTLGSMESVDTDGRTTYGVTTETQFDIRRTLELAGIVKGDPSAAMKPLYDVFSIAGGEYTGQLFSCTYGEIKGSAAEARPVSVPLADVIAAVQQFPTGMGEAPPEAVGTLVSYVADILRSIRGGSTSIGPIECSGQPEPNATVSVKVDGASSGNFEPGVYPEFRVGAISVDAGEQGTGSLGEFVFKAMDLNPTLEALDSAAGQLSDAWFDANWRRLIPSWEGLSFKGFALDAVTPPTAADPSTGTPARPSERIEAKVGEFDLSLANYREGIPTDVSISASGVEFPLPQDTTDPQ